MGRATFTLPIRSLPAPGHQQALVSRHGWGRVYPEAFYWAALAGPRRGEWAQLWVAWAGGWLRLA